MKKAFDKEEEERGKDDTVLLIRQFLLYKSEITLNCLVTVLLLGSSTTTIEP